MASKMGPKNPIEWKREERSLNKAKRQMKRDKTQRSPRRRDWHQYLDDDGVDAGFERIMPRDETDRRRAVEALIEKKPLEEDNDTPVPVSTDDASTGRVIEAGGLCRVELAGEVLLCSVRGSVKNIETGFSTVIAVGDRVVVSVTGEGEGVIEEVLPRSSHIARPDPSAAHLKQLLVANVDQLLIVGAWRNPNIWYELIDRYIITAERSRVTPVICVNKIDLAEDVSAVQRELAVYRRLGYTVLLTSAEQGGGLDALRDLLRGKITALAGLSGVGKSSLLSAVQPGFELRTGEVNEDRGQGRHTTTQAVMLPFEDGYVIDTPGIREFGLAGLDPSELAMYYPEILAVSMGCKFANCTHTHEPDCAVVSAVESGEVSEHRYHSYTEILKSL